MTLVENARLKAEALRDATGMAALADDTGLEVDALGGAPGVCSARYAGEDATYADNVDEARSTEMATACATLADRPVPHRRSCSPAPTARSSSADGVVEGVIADEPRGDRRLRLRPGVRARRAGGGRTFAEMTLAEKQALSHRGRALRALAARLREADASH